MPHLKTFKLALNVVINTPVKHLIKHIKYALT